MRSQIIILLLLIIIPAFAYGQKAPAANAGAQFINYKYKGVTPPKQLPNGVKHLGGGLIGNINADPVYGIAQTEKGALRMFWLEVSTGQDATGVTGWQVLDVLTFSGVQKSEYLFFAGDPSINCTKNSREIPNLVGRGRILRTKGSYIPSKLWIADIAKRKFVPFGLMGVKCVYSEP